MRPGTRVRCLLVDEEFGAEIARSARRDAFTLAMPVERSGQDEFDFEFGEKLGEHVEAFDPDFAKVLVRYNPDDDAELNRRKGGRLARLSGWLRANDRKFLFELLVAATPDQLDQVGGGQDAYDRDLRPDLVVRAIAQLQAADVEPGDGSDVRIGPMLRPCAARSPAATCPEDQPWCSHCLSLAHGETSVPDRAPMESRRWMALSILPRERCGPQPCAVTATTIAGSSRHSCRSLLPDPDRRQPGRDSTCR